MTLPGELVERILAMVPFPYVFKARSLSKSWHARFEPISSQVDEEKKHLAFSFQKYVAQSFTKWKSFSPTLMGRKDLVFYDRESEEWRKLPTLSFLPRECFGDSDWRVGGALLLVVVYPEINVRTSMEFFVGSVLTRAWKKLPPPIREFQFCLNFLIPMQSMYKVVVFKDDYLSTSCYDCAAQIYDSNLDAWSSAKSFSLSEGHLILSDWANFNGVLYRVVSLGNDFTLRPPTMRNMMGPHTEMTWGLLAFDVNRGTFEILQMGETDLPLRDDNVGLAVCNGSLLMLVFDIYSSFRIPAESTVLKIDLERRSWSELTTRTFLSRNCIRKNASDGNSIFFVGEGVAGGLLAYNVQENDWSNFPCPADPQPLSSEASRRTNHEMYHAPTESYQWGPVSFQPNLNPFAEV